MRSRISTTHVQQGITVVAVGGALDPELCPATPETIGAVRETIKAAQLEVGHRALVLDLSAVLEIRLEGAYLLCQAHNRAKEQDTIVVLAGIHDRPMKRLRFYGVTRFLPHYASVEEAVASLTNTAGQASA
ncbi:STAS domain-containing protein [Actinomadura sp. NPDC048394]|jgi:anti-anti-sigma regulatory factor|uniref:STAS domain-containing protein n=1 Tax=Actinomadura sp. NPDC048394 TaxID=3158223 RepID=UPI003403537D